MQDQQHRVVAVLTIAARAGVGKQTIYRWWPDKGAVVLDAYLALVGAEGDLAFPDSGNLGDDLRLALGSTVDSLADPVFERRYRALLTAIQDDPALAAALLDRLLKPWLAATKQRLRAAQRAGQIRNAEATSVVCRQIAKASSSNANRHPPG